MLRKISYLLLIIVAFVAGIYFFNTLSAVKEPRLALVYEKPITLADFSLEDHLGEKVNRERLYGNWTIAFLGYTYCPDICPLTLAKLASVHQDLASMLKEPLNIWFVSVDPNRDTQEQLKSYVSYFEHASVVGMSAGHAELFPFVRQLRLMYAIGSTDNPDYLVDHSASIVLINPKGQLVAMFKPPMEVGVLPIINTEILLEDFPLVLKKLKVN